MPLSIHRHKPPDDKGGAAVFYGEDEHGPLEVWVTFERWGALWMLTPEPATDEQRLEFGFQALEIEAGRCTPSTTAGASRLVFVG